MGNKSKQHFVFPEFLSKRPEFALSEKLKKHAKITYYQSIDDIHKICANTVELIIIEDKVYDQWSSHSPKDPPSGIILIDTGKVETIPDSPHKIMAWVSLDNMSNQCWNFTLEQCLENVKLYNDREKLESRLIRQDQNFVELHDIGVSLSSEKDLNALLNLIVSKAMNLTYADGGTLFLIESAPDSTEQQDDYWANKRLRLQVSKNHSRKIDLKPTHLLELSSDTIVGNVILNGKSILIEDYQQQTQQKEFKWGGNEFDKKFNYHTKSLLTVPIRDTEKQVIGAIQLVNSKKHPDTILSDAESFLAEVIPFEKRDVKFVESIASQAAIAIGNAKLLDSVQILFDGFINASVKAIESRDPTTSGHSSRVATLTIALAETVDQLKSGRFADTSFSADQLSEIRYASLLHDFGKIGVRERVLVKSKKLYPEEQQALMDRFRLIRAMMELKSSKEQISYFLDETHENALWKYDVNSDLLQAKLEELDDYLKLILSANKRILE